MMGLTMISCGYSLPSKVITNQDLEKIVDTSDEWIRSRTGIASRRFCNEDESCITLAIDAASKALSSSQVSPDQIDCVICATLSGDYATPSVACHVQAALNLPENIPAMDVNAACSGFIYGLETARGLLTSSGGTYALVIGCEQLSRLLDMTDRNTCVLFGDGAGAAIVKLTEDTPYETVLGARGSHDICCPGAGHSNTFIQIDGKSVFRFATSAIPNCISTIFERKDLNFDDLDWVICHQANSRIIDHCVRKLHAPADKFYKNMDRWGNTSAASIPIALGEMAAEGKLLPGQMVLLVGFGSGLTWGGALIKYQGEKEL